MTTEALFPFERREENLRKGIIDKLLHETSFQGPVYCDMGPHQGKYRFEVKGYIYFTGEEVEVLDQMRK